MDQSSQSGWQAERVRAGPFAYSVRGERRRNAERVVENWNCDDLDHSDEVRVAPIELETALNHTPLQGCRWLHHRNTGAVSDFGQTNGGEPTRTRFPLGSTSANSRIP